MTRDRFFRLIPLALLCLLIAVPFAAGAQEAPIQFAAVQQVTPVLADTAGLVEPLPAPPGRDVFNMAWSDDGQLLAMVVYDEDYRARLFVTGPGAEQVIELPTGGLEAGFGVAFTPEGNILYAAEGVFPADFSGPPTVEIRQIAPDASATPVTLGQFEHVVGCGGGSPIPADWQVWSESGFGGSYLTLQWTPLGIVHSTACSGGSASILDPVTGEDRPLGPSFDQSDMTSGGPITRLVVSPDGTKAAGVRFRYEGNQAFSSLVLIDLATGAITDVPTTGQPDQLAWSADGSIYYSTRTPSRDVAANLSDKDRALLSQSLGYMDPADMTELTGYTVEVWQVDPATGADAGRFSLDAYAVGRMQEAADGTLVFSVIPNLDAWAQAIVSGQLDMTADTNGDLQRALVPISVYTLAAGESAPALVGVNLEQFELRPAVAAG